MRLKLIALLLFLVSFNVNSNTHENTQFIEDITALLISKSECGYKLNKRIIKLSFNSVNLKYTDLLPGGEFRKEFNDNISQIKTKIHKPNGRLIFCNNVKNMLGALIQEPPVNALSVMNDSPHSVSPNKEHSQ